MKNTKGGPRQKMFIFEHMGMNGLIDNIAAAFKLIKTVIMAKDDFLIRHMMSANVLSTVVSTFFDKYVYCNNMYNSAYLDFFDYIAKVRSIIISIVLE